MNLDLYHDPLLPEIVLLQTLVSASQVTDVGLLLSVAPPTSATKLSVVSSLADQHFKASMF